MKASFRLLAGADLLLLCLTAAIGTTVTGAQNFARHFMLGILAALFTCFVHVLVFVYFMVQDKIVKQSILHHGLDVSFAAIVDRLKARALKLAMLGVASMILTTALGAADGAATASGAHFYAALGAIVLNAILFARHDVVIRENGALFTRAFGGT